VLAAVAAFAGPVEAGVYRGWDSTLDRIRDSTLESLSERDPYARPARLSAAFLLSSILRCPSLQRSASWSFAALLWSVSQCRFPLFFILTQPSLAGSSSVCEATQEPLKLAGDRSWHAAEPRCACGYISMTSPEVFTIEPDRVRFE
jgi:hypothetical protein